MSITETRTVGSIVGGEDRSGGERIESRNPANLEDLICEAAAGRRRHLRRRLPRGARGAARVGGRPGPRARQRRQADRPPRRGQQGGALAARHARDRQALPRVARRGAGDHRHLRLLPLRGPAPVRADGSERDARQAALHLPQPGWRGRDHHGRQLPGGGAVLVPRARDPVRQRRRLEARRVRAGARRRAGAAVHRRRPARRRASTSCRATARRPSRASSARSTRVSSTRSASPARRAVGSQDRRAHRPPRPGGLPRARRQEPARRDARRRPRPRGRGRAVQRLRHGRASAARRSAR